MEAERDNKNLAEMITKIQLNFEIEKAKYYWEQRAKLNWLKFENQNTIFFHSQATQRRWKNQINKLQNESRWKTEDLLEMEGIARAYFQNLFTAENTAIYKHLLTGIDHCVYWE